MFEMSGGLDIGSRNEQAVRAALAKARVSVGVAQTGGNQGRTVRIAVGEGRVTVRVAGQPPVTVLEGRGGRGGPPVAAARTPSVARVSAVSRLGGSVSAVGAIRGPRAAFGLSGAWR